MNKTTAIIYLVITSLLWSLGGLLVKLVDLHPLAIISGRSICALCLFIPYYRIKHTHKPTSSHREPFHYSYLLCGLSISSLSILFVSATKLTTAAHAIVLQFTSPIWIMIISILILKKKPQLRDIKAMFLVLIGIGLFMSNQLSSGHVIGNLLAVLSGISMATMILLLQSKQIKYPLLGIIYGNIFNVIIGLPFLLKSRFSLNIIILLMIIGIFQYGLSYILYSRSVKHLSSLNVVLITALEPILNPLWVYLIIGETITLLSMVGACLVIYTIVRYNINRISI